MNSQEATRHDNENMEQSEGPRWKPIDSTDRRVLGVLIEKAKTTPDAYPLSQNALKNGCNQKSNRYPKMDIDEADVEDAMERLRMIGAAVVIQGGHRVDKYRHLAYDWLGVDKVEIAVMAELLLRGAQSIGELRGRAARMEPIAGLAELRPVLSQLVEKRLAVYLTPPGRGAVVTHNLYQEREMEKLKREHGGSMAGSMAESAPEPAKPQAVSEASPLPRQAPSDRTDAFSLLRQEIDSIRNELAVTKTELAETREEFQSRVDSVQQDLDALNQALGNS